MNIGHNSGILSLEGIQAQLGEEFSSLVERTADLEAAAKRIPAKVEDDTVSGMVADQVKQFRDHIKDLKDAHEETKKPYLRGGKVVDDFFNPTIKALTTIKDAVLSKNTVYLTEKDRLVRIAAEAEAKAAREAAEAVLANATTDAEINTAIALEERAEVAEAKTVAPANELTRLHGAHGTATSLRSFGWKHRNVDRTKIDLEALRPYLPAEAIDQAIRAYIRANGNNPAPVKGVEFFEDKRAA